MTWTVSYQTTHMKMFQWIEAGIFTDRTTAVNLARDLLDEASSSEEIINVRIRCQMRLVA